MIKTTSERIKNKTKRPTPRRSPLPTFLFKSHTRRMFKRQGRGSGALTFNLWGLEPELQGIHLWFQHHCFLKSAFKNWLFHRFMEYPSPRPTKVAKTFRFPQWVASTNLPISPVAVLSAATCSTWGKNFPFIVMTTRFSPFLPTSQLSTEALSFQGEKNYPLGPFALKNRTSKRK